LGNGGIAPRILNLGRRWRIVVSFTPLPLYLRVYSVEKELTQYKQRWLNHVSRMEDVGYPKERLTIDLSEEEEENPDDRGRDH